MENLSWHAKEYFHKEKTNDWYWIVAIVTISIAIIAIILNDVIFGVLIIISSFTLSLFASKPPEVVLVEITGLGINVGSTHYPYANLHSFWVETREGHERIILKSKKLFMPFIVIFISEEVHPEDIRHELIQHLVEEEHIEPFLEKVMLHLGF